MMMIRIDWVIRQSQQHVHYFHLSTKEIVLHKYHSLIETLVHYHERLEKSHDELEFPQVQARREKELDLKNF